MDRVEYYSQKGNICPLPLLQLLMFQYYAFDWLSNSEQFSEFLNFWLDLRYYSEVRAEVLRVVEQFDNGRAFFDNTH